MNRPWERLDEPYLDREGARDALLVAVPGSRSARTKQITDQMLRAARLGVDFYWNQVVTKAYLEYIAKLEQVTAKLPAPTFPASPVPEEPSPSEDWVDAKEKIASVEAHFRYLHTMVDARQRVEGLFGPALAEVLDDLDGLRVLMAAYVLRDAHDNAYPEPLPVELALIAVAIGVDAPLLPVEKQENAERLDTPDKRRDRWGDTLRRARKYAERRSW